MLDFFVILYLKYQYPSAYNMYVIRGVSHQPGQFMCDSFFCQLHVLHPLKLTYYCYMLATFLLQQTSNGKERKRAVILGRVTFEFSVHHGLFHREYSFLKRTFLLADMSLHKIKQVQQHLNVIVNLFYNLSEVKREILDSILFEKEFQFCLFVSIIQYQKYCPLELLDCFGKYYFPYRYSFDLAWIKC